MSETAKKDDPKLWEKVKKKVTDGDKGGKPGQWSARKAQMASKAYQEKGGGYEGGKSDDNSLQEWSDEDWATKSGKNSGETGERYLPKEAREALSDEEYERTSDKKRADARKGKQFSAQPKDIETKTAKHRGKSGRPGGPSKSGGAREGRATKAELYERAKAQKVEGRSKMSRDELEKAVS